MSVAHAFSKQIFISITHGKVREIILLRYRPGRTFYPYGQTLYREMNIIFSQSQSKKRSIEGVKNRQHRSYSLRPGRTFAIAPIWSQAPLKMNELSRDSL